jgi:hypothetical protein
MFSSMYVKVDVRVDVIQHSYVWKKCVDTITCYTHAKNSYVTHHKIKRLRKCYGRMKNSRLNTEVQSSDQLQYTYYPINTLNAR